MGLTHLPLEGDIRFRFKDSIRTAVALDLTRHETKLTAGWVNYERTRMTSYT
jgi:hypothetical protein